MTSDISIALVFTVSLVYLNRLLTAFPAPVPSAKTISKRAWAARTTRGGAPTRGPQHPNENPNPCTPAASDSHREPAG